MPNEIRRFTISLTSIGEVNLTFNIDPFIVNNIRCTNEMGKTEYGSWRAEYDNRILSDACESWSDAIEDLYKKIANHELRKLQEDTDILSKIITQESSQ